MIWKEEIGKLEDIKSGHRPCLAFIGTRHQPLSDQERTVHGQLYRAFYRKKALFYQCADLCRSFPSDELRNDQQAQRAPLCNAMYRVGDVIEGGYFVREVSRIRTNSAMCRVRLSKTSRSLLLAEGIVSSVQDMAMAVMSPSNVYSSERWICLKLQTITRNAKW